MWGPQLDSKIIVKEIMPGTAQELIVDIITTSNSALVEKTCKVFGSSSIAGGWWWQCAGGC
jgi:hypothetical protein